MAASLNDRFALGLKSRIAGRSSKPACQGIAKGEAWKGCSSSPERAINKSRSDALIHHFVISSTIKTNK
jgi:hypothetical protein